MPKRPELIPVKESNGKWRVSVAASISHSKKRIRRWFTTKDEAEVFIAGLSDDEEEVTSLVRDIGVDLAKDALKFEEEFQYYGYASLGAACADFLARLEMERTGLTFGEIIEDFEKDQKTWSESMVRRHNRCKKRVGNFVHRPARSISRDDWCKWLDDIRQLDDGNEARFSTVNDYHSWAAAINKHGVSLGSLNSNPFELIKKARKPKDEKPEACIFTNAQVKKLLKTTWNTDPAMIPFYAVAIFAGLRTASEIEAAEHGIKWDSLDFDEKLITVFATKTGQVRHVPIEDTLVAWLEPFRSKRIRLKLDRIRLQKAKRTKRKKKDSCERIAPLNHRKRREAIVKASGLDWGREKRDIMRHTYGSNLEGKTRNPDIVRDAMGHRNYETYRQFYRNARTTKQAEAFWAITPESLNLSLPPFS